MRKSLVWIFISVIPVILFGVSPAIVSAVLGPEKGEAWGNGPWFVVGIIALTLLPIIASLRLFAGVMKPMEDAQRLMATGTPARAVIRSLGENSEGGVVTINDQPVLNLTLEVRGDFGSPYVVSFDTIIPRYAVPKVQPGAEIAVRVDPADPQKVAIDWPAMGYGG